MLYYFIRRFLYMVFVLVLISVVAFIIVQLPPGDYLTTYIMQLAETGEVVDEAIIASLRKRYGLDLPMYQQYFMWIGKMFHGDFGRSFDWNREVSDLIAQRLPLTITISLFALEFPKYHLATNGALKHISP